MPYYVYVLQSTRTTRRYVGQTDNLDARLLRHNAGMVFATAPYRPWRLVYSEEHASRSEAMLRERFLKSGRGRDFIAAVMGRRQSQGALEASDCSSPTVSVPPVAPHPHSACSVPLGTPQRQTSDGRSRGK